MGGVFLHAGQSRHHMRHDGHHFSDDGLPRATCHATDDMGVGFMDDEEKQGSVRRAIEAKNESNDSPSSIP